MSELQRSPTSSSAALAPAAPVRIVSYLVQSPMETFRVELHPGKHVVGRSAVPIDDAWFVNLESPRSAVSRYHATIVICRNGDAWIQDTGSTNGTFLAIRDGGEGLRLEPQHFYQLSSGALILFGDTELRFVQEAVSADGSTTVRLRSGRSSSRPRSHHHQHQQVPTPQQQQQQHQHQQQQQHAAAAAAATAPASPGSAAGMVAVGGSSADAHSLGARGGRNDDSAVALMEPQHTHESSALSANGYRKAAEQHSSRGEDLLSDLQRDLAQQSAANDRNAEPTAANLETTAVSLDPQGALRAAAAAANAGSSSGANESEPLLVPAAPIGKAAAGGTSKTSRRGAAASGAAASAVATATSIKPETTAAEPRPKETSKSDDEAPEPSAGGRNAKRGRSSEVKPPAPKPAAKSASAKGKAKVEAAGSKKDEAPKPEEPAVAAIAVNAPLPEPVARKHRRDELRTFENFGVSITACLSGFDSATRTKVSKSISARGGKVEADWSDECNLLIVSSSPTDRTPKILMAVGAGADVVVHSFVTNAKTTSYEACPSVNTSTGSVSADALRSAICKHRDTGKPLTGRTYATSAVTPKAARDSLNAIIAALNGTVSAAKSKIAPGTTVLSNKDLDAFYNSILTGHAPLQPK